MDWIEAVIGEKISKTDPFEKVLKDGVYLAKYVMILLLHFFTVHPHANPSYRDKPYVILKKVETDFAW